MRVPSEVRIVCRVAYRDGVDLPFSLRALRITPCESGSGAVGTGFNPKMFFVPGIQILRIVGLEEDTADTLRSFPS